MIDRQAIGRRWDADGSKRDERGRRLFAASETRAAGWGGLVAVSEISGLARSTIERGLKDLDGPAPSAGRIRRDGGGPRPLTKRDPTLLDDLRRLVEPVTLGEERARAVADLEDLSAQSFDRHRRHGFPGRADDWFQAALRLGHSPASAPAADIAHGDDQSDGGMDRSPDHRSLPLG